jgi:choline dehydrogenase-like flavoprotein
MSAALLALSRLRVAPAIALSEVPASTDLRVLGPRDARILSAIAERMTFTGDPNMPRFGDTAGLRTIDTALLQLPPEVPRQLSYALVLFEYGPPLFIGKLATFTMLTPAWKALYLEGWANGRLENRASPSRRSRTCRCSATTPDATWARSTIRARGCRGAACPARRDHPRCASAATSISPPRSASSARAPAAVVAKELAEAGREVVLLEQGGHYTKEDFTQREDEMLPLLYEDMGQRATVDQSILILQGRTVGGSTVHNLCYCFRTPEPILEKWRREAGVRELTAADLLPSFERVERMLKVKPIRPDEVNALNNKIRTGCEKLGYSGFVTNHNREQCTQSGFCLLGCPFDAKQSMLITYVPAADRAGARLYADCPVRRIVAGAGRVRRVEAEVVDALGRQRHRVTVTANVVVLCAGAINTPALLLQSGIANANGRIGRTLHLHPSVLMSGVYDEDIYGYRGIPQSYYVDEFIDLEHDPDSGYILMPVYGFPVMTASQLPGFGRAHFRMMQNYHRMVGILVLMHDQSSGTVQIDRRGRPQIRYTVNAAEQQRFAEGLQHCAEILFASGAKHVIAPYTQPVVLEPDDSLDVFLERGVRQGDIPIASTHPQSTCPMGEDKTRAVVNSYGQSHELPNLFICDMSVFPTSLGAPPQISTASLADRTAHYIAANWSSLRGPLVPWPAPVLATSSAWAAVAQRNAAPGGRGAWNLKVASYPPQVENQVVVRRAAPSISSVTNLGEQAIDRKHSSYGVASAKRNALARSP